MKRKWKTVMIGQTSSRTSGSEFLAMGSIGSPMRVDVGALNDIQEGAMPNLMQKELKKI